MYHFTFGKRVIMASIFRRKHKTKTTYRTIVRRKGFKTVVKSFNTRTDAQKLSRYIERNLDRGISTDFIEASRVTIRDLLKRYLKERKHKGKKGWRMYQQHSSTVAAQHYPKYCAMNSC